MVRVKPFILPISVVFLALCSPSLVVSQDHFVEQPATAELLEAVREGGFVLYLRHGATDSAQPDQVPIDLDDCATQRPLTDAGRAEIAWVGEQIRQAALPLGEIFASPLCRAVESAQLAFGDQVTVERDLMYTAHLTTEEKRPVVAMTASLLQRPVEPGSNRVVVAHAPNLADLIGYFPAVEGTLVIFRPLGDGFDYQASIQPAQWPELLETLPPIAP